MYNIFVFKKYEYYIDQIIVVITGLINDFFVDNLIKSYKNTK